MFLLVFIFNIPFIVDIKSSKKLYNEASKRSFKHITSLQITPNRTILCYEK